MHMADLSLTAAHTSTLCSRASCVRHVSRHRAGAAPRRDIIRRIGHLGPAGVSVYSLNVHFFTPCLRQARSQLRPEKVRRAPLSRGSAPRVSPTPHASRRSTLPAEAVLPSAALQPRCVPAKHQHRPPRHLFPARRRCLAAPEAAHLLLGSRLYSTCEPNGWATFSLLVLAPARLNRDGGWNKEVIQPDCRTVAQHGRNGARWHCQSLAPAHPQRPHQLRAGDA